MIIRCQEVEVVRLVLGSMEFHENAEAVKIEMWYDRSRRNWVLYPVDAEGNQLEEARYGFGKTEALKIKRDMEEEYEIR